MFICIWISFACIYVQCSDVCTLLAIIACPRAREISISCREFTNFTTSGACMQHHFCDIFLHSVTCKFSLSIQILITLLYSAPNRLIHLFVAWSQNTSQITTMHAQFLILTTSVFSGKSVSKVQVAIVPPFCARFKSTSTYSSTVL